MIENVKAVKNPLTIIAIFAGIAEISGTVVLPFITPENQAVFVWFLIIFPVALIVLFFLTLNFNNKVLYAPSDFQDEQNYVNMNQLPRATKEEKIQKLNDELEDIELEIEIDGEDVKVKKIDKSDTSTQVVENKKTEFSPLSFNSTTTNMRSVIVRAEEFALKKISEEFNSKIERDVKSYDGFVFDGIVREEGVVTAIEIKFIETDSRLAAKMFLLDKSIFRMYKGLQSFTNRTSNCKLLLVFVTHKMPSPHFKKEIFVRMKRIMVEYPINFDIRFYDVPSLEKEFGFIEQ